MLQKIIQLQHHPVVDQLRDVRVIGFLAFGIVVLLVSYSGVNVIQTNFRLEKQVARLQQENEVAQLQNTNDQLRNQYYQSDEYVELLTRKQFGKALPGETLLLVPKQVALSHTVPSVAVEAEAPTEAPKPWYQRNIESWRSFFIHSSGPQSS